MASTDLARGLKALKDSRPDYVEAGDYYEGEVDELFTSSKLRKLYARHAARLRINFAQTPVNAVADRIELAAVVANAGSQAGSDQAQAALDDFWDDNELDLELPNAVLRACEFGDAYMVLEVEDDTDDDGTTDVEAFYNSPLVGRMMYSPDNPRVKEFYIKRWETLAPSAAGGKDAVVRVNLMYPPDAEFEHGRVERYVTGKGADGWDATQYGRYLDPEDDPADPEAHIIDTGLDFLPVYHLRAGGRPYGKPVHKNAYGPQDAINKLAISHLTNIDYTVAPQRWALEDMDAGVDASEVDDVDADYYHDADNPAPSGPGPDASGRWDDQDRPGESGLKSTPGGIAWLRGVKQVGQFDAAPSSNWLDSIVLYIKMMAHTTTTPLGLFDAAGEMPSGAAQRAADAPLVKKTGKIRLSFDSALRDMFGDVLAVLGHPDVQVNLQWASNQIVDDKESWDTAAVKLSNGVPVRQVLSELGYTTAQLDSWQVPDARFSGDVSVQALAAMLEQIGKAVQALSAGVAAGGITEAEVQLVVAKMLALLDVESQGAQ